jgi:outer membrane protein
MRTRVSVIFVAGLVAADAHGQGPPQATSGPDIPIELTRTEPSGLTADQVGARAAATSFTAKAQDESLRGAAARVDQAWVAFLPRLSALGRYTRVSDFTAPVLLSAPPGINQVFTTQPPALTPGLNPGQMLAAPVPTVAIAPILDNYLLQGTMLVPITDYFLRINQAYTAATNARDAAAYDAVAVRARAAAEGKVVFYTWLRTRGAAVVAIQALFDQRTHLADARNQFAVGGASRADVLRAETAVAAAELQVERARDLALLGEKQLRLALHAPAADPLIPGENIDGPPAPVAGTLPRLTQEALGARFEIKSIDSNAAAARHQAKVARAAQLPTLGAFADAIYANPNLRKFPPTDEWFPSWDVGAQITWSPNDAVSAGFAGGDADSRASALEAQRGAVRDGIELEVMQAHQAVLEGNVALDVTKRELASAQEAYRVARDLFLSGRSTSTTLTDAETELTRARLDALNAKVDTRIARVRLEHALGRDTKLRRE